MKLLLWPFKEGESTWDLFNWNVTLPLQTNKWRCSRDVNIDFDPNLKVDIGQDKMGDTDLAMTQLDSNLTEMGF